MGKFLFAWLLLLSLWGRAQWSPFGPAGATDNTVVDFEYYNNELYATGLFSQINGVSAKAVAKWTGTTWVSSGDFEGWGHSLRSIDTALFLAKYSVSNDSNYVWYYNGTVWDTLGDVFRLVGVSGLKPDLYDIIKYNNDIYVCGEFNRCGADTINGIARWNGNKWVGCGMGLKQSIPGGPPNIYPHQLYVFNNKLYVVGNFHTAGGIVCDGVASWDGTYWMPYASGFNKVVYAVTSFQGDLYVGGEFTSSGSTALGSLAKWNGTQWIQPGLKLSTVNPQSGNFCFVHSLLPFQYRLYIAGGFNRLVTASGSTLTCGSIVSYDGYNSYDLMNGGADSDVEGIIPMQSGASSTLLVGGIFHNVGTPTIPCNNLATYQEPTTGIEESSHVDPLLLYPNPIHEQVRIQSSETLLRLAIYDLTGKLLLEQIPNTSEMLLNLNTFEPGCYLLNYKTAHGSGQQKLLKL